MLEGAGLPALPLVSRSPDHPEDFAADIVNAQRLARWCGPGEKFVFDGGYVFDSVFRTITERGLDATWIRRGLWKPGQLTDVALEREKIFNRVIVPGEAFDELNDAYSFGPSVHRVGPIVADHRADRTALRAEIAKRAGRDFDRLVVTMLGGGAAPARAGIVQYLAALIAMRTNTLQIVVAWPGTRVPAGHFRWPNTVVARSRQALDLAVAADVTVSAAGYNSFHELLYHQVPAILVPQDAPFLDDQTARAEAAARRGLAAHVGETDLLELGRTLGGALDGALADEIRGALNEADLPARGTEAAAGLIAEGTP
jgi:predicted glycosyltransferase